MYKYYFVHSTVKTVIITAKRQRTNNTFLNNTKNSAKSIHVYNKGKNNGNYYFYWILNFDFWYDIILLFHRVKS